jgi:hypothetical protein
MIAWKSLQLLLLCALLAAWSNAQAQEAKPNGSQLQPVYSPANPKGGWKVNTQETRAFPGGDESKVIGLGILARSGL